MTDDAYAIPPWLKAKIRSARRMAERNSEWCRGWNDALTFLEGEGEAADDTEPPPSPPMSIKLAPDEASEADMTTHDEPPKGAA